MSLFLKDLPPTGRSEKEELVNALAFIVAVFCLFAICGLLALAY